MKNGIGPSRVCVNCRYAARVADSQDQAECRRYPPQVTHLVVPVQANMLTKPSMGINGFAGYPIVRLDQWCGEFQTNIVRGVQ